MLPSAPLREELPPGVAIDIGGPLENSNKALNYLIEPVPAMFIVMIILLIMQLKDVRKMIVIACTAPMGVIGVMIGLLLFGSSLGFLAELGILALTGIIIRNSVVLLDQIDQHLEAGMPPYEAVLESADVYQSVLGIHGSGNCLRADWCNLADACCTACNLFFNV